MKVDLGPETITEITTVRMIARLMREGVRIPDARRLTGMVRDQPAGIAVLRSNRLFAA